jgi:hypothetical protein
MRITTIVLAGLLCSAAGTSHACMLPKLLLVPAKEAVAGKEAEIRADANRYFAEMQAYTACVQAEIQAVGGDAAPEIVKRVLVSRNNSAVAEAEFMMKLFNENVAAAAAAAAPPAN